MKKGIVVFDVDGTIIKNNKISKLTIEAFDKLKKNGYILVLSTGRALPAIDGVLKEMNFENMICSAGGVVIVNNKIIHSKPMKKESLKELVEYFDKHNIIYNMEANDYIWMKKGKKEKYLRLFDVPKKDVVSEDEYNKAVERLTMISNRTMEVEDINNIEVNKIHYYEADVLYDGNESPISYKEIEEEFGDRYKCVSLSLSKLFSGGEICEKEISKKVGMDIVLKYFNIDKENIYAIGDDYNDREMLEYAPKSIAMGNAPEEIKKLCSYVTKSVENDGFYYAMKHFGLI